MRIKVTTTYLDRQAADPGDAEVEAGSELTVTAERGAELIAAGVAVEVEPATTRKPRAKRARKAPVASPPAPPPPSEPAPDADPAPNA